MSELVDKIEVQNIEISELKEGLDLALEFIRTLNFMPHGLNSTTNERKAFENLAKWADKNGDWVQL